MKSTDFAIYISRYLTLDEMQAQQLGTIPAQMTVSPHILRHSKAKRPAQSLQSRDWAGHRFMHRIEIC